MIKLLKQLLSLLFFLLLAACNEKNEITSLLSEAESYMPVKPDSALCLLDSIKHPERLSRKEQALWCFLYTAAQEKKQIKHTSDSLIQIAVRYYEKTDWGERKMQAYYYCGRVLQDLNDAPQAQAFYLKAYDLGKTLDAPALSGELCANLGSLYTLQKLYQPALNYQKKAVDYFMMDEDTVSVSVTLRNIARIYVCENKLDSAVIYYSIALLHTSDLYKLNMSNELADAYNRVGDYERGLSVAWNAYSKTKTREDSCRVSLTLGDLYFKIGKMDSAYHYLSFARKSTDLRTLCGTYRNLSLFEKSRNNFQGYMTVYGQFEILRDSLDKQLHEEMLARVESLYNYRMVEREKENYKLEADRKTVYLYRFLAGGSFLLLVAVCVAFCLFKKKKQKEEQLDQFLRFQEQKYKESQEYLKERNVTIAKLEQQIAAEQKRIETNTLQNERKLAQETFFTSDLYLGLCTKWKKLDETQWPEVVKAIDHVLYRDFTSKIRMLYPRISELDLVVCCLTRLDIPVGRIASLLSVNSQAISNKRKRLYEKLTNQKGTAQDFDEFVKDF
ncbi:hypothetical protein DXD68_05620 [Parabacteroides sp. TM07-1AC]|uniref:tetratricopeptide repeat protein n=1 Tax=Parabacteroides sp. TM07-1AC TaxID=2292363 RepID=UPI000EFE424D|nr:hypothetical protein [Parabacteroides sp. TM07-1AC]RHU29360.1 hypothetical protein DXD68_05620 [Parabacteroides sp. TM07-1AC]